MNGQARDRNVAQTDVKDAEHQLWQLCLQCTESGLCHAQAMGISKADNLCWPKGFVTPHHVCMRAAHQGAYAHMKAIVPNAVTFGRQYGRLVAVHHSVSLAQQFDMAWYSGAEEHKHASRCSLCFRAAKLHWSYRSSHGPQSEALL